jgi:hypothetical protein
MQFEWQESPGFSNVPSINGQQPRPFYWRVVPVPSCRGRTDFVISLPPRLRRTLIGTFSLSFTDGCLMTIVLP